MWTSMEHMQEKWLLLKTPVTPFVAEHGGTMEPDIWLALQLTKAKYMERVCCIEAPREHRRLGSGYRRLGHAYARFQDYAAKM